LADFLDFVKSYGKDVWVCTREEIADFWKENQFPKGVGSPIKPPEPTSVSGDEQEEEGGTSQDEEIVAEPLDADGVSNGDAAGGDDGSEEGDVI
jgi:hypothetical protein